MPNSKLMAQDLIDMIYTTDNTIPKWNVTGEHLESVEHKCIIEEYYKTCPEKDKLKPVLIACPCPKCSTYCIG